MSQLNSILISIIVPCYNAEKYISECLDSLTNQTYLNWECILIDDGSTDNTLDLLEKYSCKSQKFKLVSQENKGLSKSRNLGIELANGAYIFFLDSDDIITNNSLQNFINEVANDDRIEVVTGITTTFIGKNLDKISQLINPKEGTILYDNEMQEVLLKTIEYGLTPVAQNRLYKKEFLKQNKLEFRNGILHEDELWFFETMYKAKNVKFICKKTYLYRVDNHDSITKNLGIRNFNSYIEILGILFEKYYINNKNTHKKAVVSRYMSYFKKLIIDFTIREKKKLDDSYVGKLEEALNKFKTSSDEFNLLSKNNEIYYQALNKLSLHPFHTIEKYFFRNPVNSIRKRYKLILIIFLK